MASTRTPTKRRPTKTKSSPAAYYRELSARFRLAAEGFSFREVGELTRCNAETVRRHLGHGRAPAFFLAQFVHAFEVEVQWLLLGQGPMRRGKAAKRKSTK